MVAPDLLQLVRPIGSLREDPRNARRHDARNIEAIRRSLEEFGQRKPVVATTDGTVVAGNGTLRAALDLGWTEIAVATFEDQEKARAFAIADNRTSDLSDFDEDLLREAFEGMDDGLVEACGFSADEIRRLAGPKTGLTDPDDAPSKPDKPTTRPGDLYLLGNHRLLCGDATDLGAVQRLMDGDRATALWTDPPYGVEYVGGTSKALSIENDSPAGLRELLDGAFKVATLVLEDGAAVYICHPAGALGLTFADAFRAVEWRLHQTLVWVKDSMVLGRSDYHYRHEAILYGTHEPILYGYTQGGGRRGRFGGAGWFGGNSETSVLEYPRPRRNAEHPTMKPVGLVAAMLENSTEVEDLVLDLFGGSGSTLIASEQLERRARLMELDPLYCDVIVQRWEAFTGRKAERRD